MALYRFCHRGGEGGAVRPPKCLQPPDGQVRPRRRLGGRRPPTLRILLPRRRHKEPSRRPIEQVSTFIFLYYGFTITNHQLLVTIGSFRFYITLYNILSYRTLTKSFVFYYDRA